jgi:hypothetical protein
MKTEKEIKSEIRKKLLKEYFNDGKLSFEKTTTDFIDNIETKVDEEYQKLMKEQKK